MRIKSSFIILEEGDSLTVEICGKGLSNPLIGITNFGNTDITICNNFEERNYILRKTKNDGFKLKEEEMN